jgi:hypothetical protein
MRSNFARAHSDSDWKRKQDASVGIHAEDPRVAQTLKWPIPTRVANTSYVTVERSNPGWRLDQGVLVQTGGREDVQRRISFKQSGGRWKLHPREGEEGLDSSC